MSRTLPTGRDDRDEQTALQARLSQAQGGNRIAVEVRVSPVMDEAAAAPSGGGDFPGRRLGSGTGVRLQLRPGSGRERPLDRPGKSAFARLFCFRAIHALLPFRPPILGSSWLISTTSRRSRRIAQVLPESSREMDLAGGWRG